MSQIYDIGIDRLFFELRQIIYLLTIQGGPVTKQRIQNYCQDTYDISPVFCNHIITKAESEGIVKFEQSKGSYVLLPSPRKSSK